MPPKTLARTAGALYLIASLLFILGGSLRARVVIPGDAATTAENIRASATIFRVGLLSDLLSGTVFVLTALALYVLLKHVDQVLAATIVIFAALGAAFGVVASLDQYTALTVAVDHRYASALGPAGSDAVVMLLADTQRNGLIISDLFSGLWLLPMGYLVMRSEMFPRWLGALLLFGGFSWLAHLVVQILLPELSGQAAILILGTVGELVFILWLLVRGVRAPAPLPRSPS